MISLLTIILFRELSLFSRRVKFHFLYYHLIHGGKDEGLVYLARRTALVENNRPFQESEEEILQIINDELSQYRMQDLKALKVIKLPNFTKLYYTERTMKRRRLYKFLYEQKDLITRFCLYWYPEVVKDERKYLDFMAKKQEKLDQNLELITDSSYVFVCFNTFEALRVFRFMHRTKKQKKNIEKLNLKRITSRIWKVSPLIRFSDMYWKHCHYQPPVTANCLQWKVTVVAIFIVILLLFSTPTIIINFILTNSPFIKDVFGQEYTTNDFFPYLLTQFLPPLAIIGINRLFYFLIFRATQREKKVRLSRYHLKVSHVSFLYIVWNSLLLPGLALPTGLNFYTYLFGSSKVSISRLIKNFYGYTNINFFITISIQKIFLSYFGLTIQFGLIIHYYLSPTTFSFIKKYFNINYTLNMLRESATFNFGYYYALNMVVFWTGLVYAVYSPFITFINMCYLLMRCIFDLNVMLNLYKNDVESNGKLIYLQKNRLVIGLLLVQVCLLLTTISDKKFVATGMIAFIFALSLLTYYFVLKPYLRFSFVCEAASNKQQQIITERDIEDWGYVFQHPFCHKYDPIMKDRKFVNNSAADYEEEKALNLKMEDMFPERKRIKKQMIFEFFSQQDEELPILQLQDPPLDQVEVNRLNALINQNRKKNFSIQKQMKNHKQKINKNKNDTNQIQKLYNSQILQQKTKKYDKKYHSFTNQYKQFKTLFLLQLSIIPVTKFPIILSCFSLPHLKLEFLMVNLHKQQDKKNNKATSFFLTLQYRSGQKYTNLNRDQSFLRFIFQAIKSKQNYILCKNFLIIFTIFLKKHIFYLCCLLKFFS